jgi:HJR/Mrr/RecB family endonuclease
MNQVHDFKVGEIYSNDQIRLSLDVENLGGIRPALDAHGDARHVAILTAAETSGKLASENPYKDRIEGDILLYTAQGRQGHQELSGRNKRLLDQYAAPLPFFGFINLGKQLYRFLGLLELLRHFQETQADGKGEVRKVWLFELRIHASPEVVPIEGAKAICASILAESRQNNAWSKSDRELVAVADDGDPLLSASSLKLEQIRARLLEFQPYDFEKFLCRMMESDGFRAVSVTKASGDGGIDLNAYVVEANDYFAGTHVQVQAKRWRHTVGNGEINSFRGALSSTAKGVFVTTSHFTRAAVAEAQHDAKPSITLIDGLRLSKVVHRLGLEI